MEDLREQALRDSKKISLWQKGPFSLDSADDIFAEGTLYDVLIIGGGITGLTTALLLQKQGRQCILAEAYTLGFGTTGGTTAHLNTYFDTSYDHIEKNFNEEAAKLVALSGKEAISLIRNLTEQYNINCDLEFKDGYLYAETEEEVKMLGETFEASQRAGVEVAWAAENGVSVPFTKAIMYAGQAQFHPLKYIYGLAKAFVDAGGVILENTLIRESDFADGVHSAKSDTVAIKAQNLVYATHMPPGITVLDVKCAPYRSYVLALKLGDNSAYPTALSYDMKDPYHYFRTHIIDGQKYLVLGGEDHKTGHEDPDAAFEALEQYARQYYDIIDIPFKWSSQYYTSADGLPYIGELPLSNNTYVASGYNGNGMIYGTIAGKILSDILCGIESPYTKLFSPSRVKPIAGFMEYVKENADVAYRFIADRITADSIGSLTELEAGTGAIVKYNDKKLAIYKDEQGKVTALNPVCTHTRCIVHFNNAEKSWDCPCHGGRFDLEGNVVTGPPRHNLQKLDI